MTKTARDIVDPKEIAMRLKALRIVIGVDQRDFARSIDVNMTSYNNWERGTSKGGMPAHGALRIFKHYKVEPNYFYINDPDGLPNAYRDKVLKELASIRANSIKE